MTEKTVYGIVIAMWEEAAPLIELLDLEKSADDSLYGLDIYKKANIYLSIAGIGCLNAGFATQYIINRFGCNYIINLGTCGATGAAFEPCEILSVKRVYKRDFDLSVFGYNQYEIPGIGEYIECITDNSFTQADCYTSDVFVTADTPVKQDVLVEMEAYAVAFVAKKFNCRCSIYKVVSDMTVTNTDGTEFESNLPGVSKILARHIADIINENKLG